MIKIGQKIEPFELMAYDPTKDDFGQDEVG